jgi:hypothetical protein
MSDFELTINRLIILRGSSVNLNHAAQTNKESILRPRNITYPVKAKKATWEAAKTLADKTKTTGLAAKLKDAETAWAAIPFDALDPKMATITDVATAKAARTAAVAAMKKVPPAFKAIDAARTLAQKTNANTALSKPAQRAAGEAYVALTALYGLLNDFGTTDFDNWVSRYTRTDYAKASGQLTNVKIGAVATATHATWDRYTLKATGVTWKPAFDASNIGKKFKIEARQTSDDHAQESLGSTSGQAKFNADLKLTKGSANTAEFEA